VSLAQQLHAVESALSRAKHELIHDHIDSLPQGGYRRGDEAAVLQEMRALSKYL
jgi:DNA-binding FrmR family transcriptional regulator